MRTTLTIFSGAILLAFLASGCSLETPATVDVDLQPEGAEIFANYMAVGNSLTAGYMDGGLIINGQSGSFPTLIARQMGYPDGALAQPLFQFPGLGSTDTGNPLAAAGVLYFNGTTVTPVGVTTGTDPADFQTNVLGLFHPSALQWPVPFSNLGVPGATTLDMTNAVSSTTAESFDPLTMEGANPYFDLVLRGSVLGSSTVVEQIIARGPTFMTLWIGNNDVLGGATSGSPEMGVNLKPAATFETLYAGVIDAIVDGIEARHGYRPVIVTANIPSISSAPYFMAPTIFNGLVAAATEGAVTEVVTEEADVEFFRYPALGYIAGVLGEGGNPFPLPAKWTLTTAEVTVVEDLVVAYNTAIANVAGAKGIPVYDANAEMANVDPMTGAMHFLPLLGGLGDIQAAAATTLFSLDGIHPNNKGYGVIANGFLATMNAAMGTAFPLLTEDQLNALVWDPTYGQLEPEPVTAFGLSPAGANAIDAMFR